MKYFIHIIIREGHSITGLRTWRNLVFDQIRLSLVPTSVMFSFSTQFWSGILEWECGTMQNFTAEP